jgi:hypothetical protein
VVLTNVISQTMHIRTVTIHMQPPGLSGTGKRRPAGASALAEQLLVHEETLRKSAYQNTDIQTDASFFDDADMRSVYYLVIVYDKRSNTPLLSARYYFERPVIDGYLKGDDTQETTREEYETMSCFRACKEERVFLADRLSGNTENELYVRNRSTIFLQFYLEILRHNRTGKFILMARKEPYERLLTKYLRLGLTIVGSTRLRGKAHWILLGDIKEIRMLMQRAVFMNSYLILKLLIGRKTIR